MKSKKVLIVENNDLNRTLFENLIGQLYSFESVKNGVEAVEKASKDKFDLILMAIQMPNMDGITAAKIIWRQSIFQCPIIAVSTYSADATCKSYLEMGFDGFISKPILPKEFLEVISSTLNPREEPETTEKESLILDQDVFQQLMKYNSLENIKSIYTDFLEEFDQLINKIDEAFTEKDQQILIEQLHTMKGNSGSLGVNEIYNLSSAADLLARSQEWNSLEIAVKKLKNERELFEKYLQEETTFNP
ncbi:Hpt domain-containing response regulator [Algoriphagus chordae]|uniref:CheY-like chemotaxis protein n=1 Tax=Algoriphagus chordae TaxID=237019 RepID=A0A2W7QTW1_9BACT|nr:response regulator [Algoriphagus chordae]PZX50586.1 CheY-like chemotaxis protein [Algoriphagus chordae]